MNRICYLKNTKVPGQNQQESSIRPFKNNFVWLKKFLLLIALSSYSLLQAQQSAVPLLERKVNINANDQTIESVLAKISDQAGIVFSYSPEAINYQNKISIQAANKPVKLVLSNIFNNDINFKAKGKYVILKRNPSSQKVSDKQIIEGYVIDVKSGEKLTDASIYDQNLLASAVTDQYGYFRIQVPRDKPLTSIHISKLGYADTLLVSKENDRHKKMMEIALNSADTTTKKKETTSAFKKFIPQWLIPKKLKIHSLNLNDSIFRKVQFSIIPMVSTNMFLTGNIENNVSFNLTIGYVYGIKRAEFGGIINIVRTNAGVCQFAGVGNIVGGNFRGFQSAGVFNYARSVMGVQSAGVINTSYDKSNVQIAGTLNLARESNIQAAGVANFSIKSGVQLAGVFNIAEKSDIIQVAGVFNRASTANTQISGLINKARLVNGLQLSIINLSDSCAGIPIGFFNYVKTGYHKLEFSYDETSQASVAFRSGTKLFHNIFNAGIFTNQFDKGLWTYGYGIGTSFGNPNKLLFDIDLSVNQLLSKNNYSFKNNLYKIYFGIDQRILHKLSLAAGLSFNLLTSDTGSLYYSDIYSKIPRYTISNHTNSNGTNVKTWIGAKIALRLF